MAGATIEALANARIDSVVNGRSHDPGHAKGAVTIWSVGASAFEPGSAPFMVNYRVADLHALLAALRAEGCQVLDKVEESEYGKFGWVIDPEGRKVELWQPPEGS